MSQHQPQQAASMASSSPYSYQTPLENSPGAGSSSQTDAGEGSPDTSIGQSSNAGSDAAHAQGPAQSQAQPQAQATRVPAAIPAACLACRSKHLKCDGQKPCSRCESSDLECTYIASRRGFKGPRKTANPNKRQAVSPPPEPDAVNQSGCPAGSGYPAAPVPQPNGAYGSVQDVQLYGLQGTFPGASDRSLSKPLAEVSVAERCIDAFYRYFHAAHPFALPRDYLLPMAKSMNLEPLLAAMRWVGSLFIENIDRNIKDNFRQTALQLLDDNPPSNGFLVQAMMILIVGLDGNCDQDKAREILMKAESLALALQLNTRAFAAAHGRGLPVLEESWRRTWWDLFIIDGMIAGVHQVTNFALYDAPADVALPCEEYEYLSGIIPHPKYLEELEDLEFSGSDSTFSSFAYRILCGRNLGRFMRLSPIQGPDDENLTRVETSLTNWRLHLPASKKDAMQPDGNPDEMMFQAHMMINATSLLLHRQHSQLDSSPAKSVTSCAPYRPVKSGEELFNIHTHHTLVAANEISKLITHRAPLLTHTHFFTCVVSLSSIVHLSRWAQHFYLTSLSASTVLTSPLPYQQSLSHGVDDDLRQLIRLNIGALGQLSSVWGAAATARGQVQGVAREIYQAKKQRQLSPVYWAGFSQEEVVSSIAADDTILGDIQAYQGLSILP